MMVEKKICGSHINAFKIRPQIELELRMVAVLDE
jgi:hypothetical protein